MTHTFDNFAYSFAKGGKPIFAPSAKGSEWGEKIRLCVAKHYVFDDFVYHFKDGSHVLALHKHRKNTFFCRVDIERFFYSIRRNRVRRSLREIGIRKAETFAKWSTVKSPYDDGGYVLPYGFIQSPILATLVLMKSSIGSLLRDLDAQGTTVSVYMDDICLSSNDKVALCVAFESLNAAIAESGFSLNAAKTRLPARSVDIFNCGLTHGSTEVLPERIAEFYSEPRSIESAAGFEQYVDIVRSHTWRVHP
ncbi:reverse transcriptase domain-containing protein [Camelimonas sp. ID_303_24]